MSNQSRRLVLFSAIAGSCLAIAVAYFALAVRRTSVAAAPAEPARASVLAPGPAAATPVMPAGPFLLFRRTSLDVSNGALAFAPLDNLTSPSLVTTLRCLRVHMAGGRGVCLASRGATSFRARLFDHRFSVRAELPLAGVPSRVQVAPDGKLAATTVFVSGHSYADAGFSTQTSIVDLETGQWLVENLETFTVRRNGVVVRSVDFNFWGVTFLRDGRSFFATLGTRGQTLLVRGSIDHRSVDVVEGDVECPSLSPDNRRLAFKRRTSGGLGPATWQIWVMDLETRKRHVLKETRSVDDQVQWLDNARVMYGLPTRAGGAATMDEWILPADGSGQPQLYLPQAYSAAVVGA